MVLPGVAAGLVAVGCIMVAMSTLLGANRSSGSPAGTTSGTYRSRSNASADYDPPPRPRVVEVVDVEQQTVPDSCENLEAYREFCVRMGTELKRVRDEKIRAYSETLGESAPARMLGFKKYRDVVHQLVTLFTQNVRDGDIDSGADLNAWVLRAQEMHGYHNDEYVAICVISGAIDFYMQTLDALDERAH